MKYFKDESLDTNNLVIEEEEVSTNHTENEGISDAEITGLFEDARDNLKK